MIDVAPNYREVVGTNPINAALFGYSSYVVGGPPVWQRLTLGLHEPGYLRRAIAEAHLIHVEQPWQFAAANRNREPGATLVYAAENIEQQLLRVTPLRRLGPARHWVERQIREAEDEALEVADLVIACTEEDRLAMLAMSSRSPESVHVIENGVDTEGFRPASTRVRLDAKRSLGLEGKTVVLFAGSGHQPNVVAARQIVRWSRSAQPDVVYVIVGTVGRHIDSQATASLRVTGSVVDVTPYFAAADVAVNPVTGGGGSNLKMAEYLASGLPVVTTVVGARGIPQGPLVADVEEFPDIIESLDFESRSRMGAQMREIAEKHLSWTTLGAHLRDIYRPYLS